MVCSSGVEQRCGREHGAANGGLRRYSPAQWGGGVAPRQTGMGHHTPPWTVHCLVHEMARSCGVRRAWSTAAHAAYKVHSVSHAAAWKRQASGWASASSGERDSSMRLRWRASRGAAAATICATARVCTHTPSKPSPAQLAALCSRNASYSQKADASCRREGGVGGGGGGGCNPNLDQGCCCCGGGCGGCGGGGDACGVTTCVTDAAALACACAREAATLRALCTCEAGCEGVPDRA